jgi:FtsZ-interacting cell division protein ZipA
MKLSESTGRGFAFMAPIENAHEQARAIDRFRKRFDSIFVVNIVPLEDEVFEGPVIDRCATQIGLAADDNGFYARYKPMGKQRVCLYSLANFSDTGEFDMDNLRAVRTRGVTFFTRPTINRSPGAVFSEMVDAARAFASRIKGEVIAPGYEDLSNEDVEKIRQSIDNVAREMERYGINPGSDEATRLF